MKRFLKAILLLPLQAASAYARGIARWWPSAGFYWNDRMYARVRSLTASVVHPGPDGDVRMTFFVPNEVCRYRAESFAIKEPETLEWIDRFGGAGAFFDVGANVGLYSVYYAKTQPGTVYAFEPSVLNLGLLARNASVNGLASRIVIVPNPLTSENQVAAFHLTMLDEGGAMSSFGADRGHDGKAIQTRMDYETAGMSLDFLLQTGVIPQSPAMLKIDVDGIEHLVLRGAVSTLRSRTLQTVLIEVNDDYRELADDVSALLDDAGFVLAERRQAPMVADGVFASTFNQIWVRRDGS